MPIPPHTAYPHYGNSYGQFFYQLLPFAEAVGQGQTFAKGFGEIRMGPCFWLDGLRKPPRTAEAFYEVYQQLLRRMAGK